MTTTALGLSVRELCSASIDIRTRFYLNKGSLTSRGVK
jgi:hypothetical protein